MTSYPVHFGVEPPFRFARVQLVTRFVAFMVLGLVGLSFGTVFLLAYVALPLFGAVRIASHESARQYLRADGPRIVRALHWFAALSAWAGLTVERLPLRRASETCTLTIDDLEAHPRAGALLLRIVTGLPSALGLAVAGLFGILVWLWAAFSILFAEHVGHGPFHYLVGLQRWTVRLLAYQAGLVDAYPPFSFADSELFDDTLSATR